MLLNELTSLVQKALNNAKALALDVVKSNPEIVAMAAAKDYKSLQQWIEVNFSKQEKLAAVQQFFFNNEETNKVYETVCEDEGLNFNLVKKAVAMLSLHRRIGLESFFNMMKNDFEEPESLKKFFKGLEETEFVERQGNLYITTKRFTLTETQEIQLDLFQSNPPMIYRPKKIRGIRNGYLNLNRSVFTKKACKHNNVPRDFLDLQNHIPYRINYSAWDHWIKDHIEIPERKKDASDTEYDKTILEAIRLHFKKAFTIELYRQLGIEKIYILTQYDYRGRNYAIAYLFNPQGTDADKALLAFEPSEINAEGEYWLKISIANCFNCKYQDKDLDKHTFEMRKQWFDYEMEPLFSLESKDFYQKLNKLASDADSPACFWVQMENMYFIYQSKKLGLTPKSWVITHWDATASGYQLQAIFARDWDIARLTNVVPNKKEERMDLYTSVYSSLLAAGISSKYTRTEIKKKCLIPAVYNSTRSIKECFAQESEQEIFNDVMNKFKMWKLNRRFPTLWNPGWLEYSFTLPDGFKVYKKLLSIVPASIEYEGSTLNLYFYENKGEDWSLELGPNMTHACDGLVARELARRMNFSSKFKMWLYFLHQHKELWTYKEDQSRKTMQELIALAQRYNFWSMRILKEITPSNIDLVPEEIFNRLYNELPLEASCISEIHDSFGVHPNHVKELMQQYRYILRDLARSRYLPEVIGELKGQQPGYFECSDGEKMAQAIMNSTYALC